MNKLQQLQKEIDALNAKRKTVIKENTAECNAPTVRKPYSYRKSISPRFL